MNLHSRIRQIEKYIRDEKMRDTVLFFKGRESYEIAKKNGEIKDGAICIIDDIPEDDD